MTTVQQDIAVRRQCVAEDSQLVGIVLQVGDGQRGGADQQFACRAVGDEMDGVNAVTAIQDFRHLRQAVPCGIQHVHFRAGLGAIHQRLIIRDTTVDK